MSKLFANISKAILILFLLFVGFSFLIKEVRAASGSCYDPKNKNQVLATAEWPGSSSTNQILRVTVNFTERIVPGKYYVIITNGHPIGATDYKSGNTVNLTSDDLRNSRKITFSISGITQINNKYYVKLQKDGQGDVCSPSEFGTIAIHLPAGDVTKAQCSISVSTNVYVGEDFTINQSASNAPSANSRFLSLIFKRADFDKLPKDPYAQIGDQLQDFPGRLFPADTSGQTHIGYVKEGRIQDVTYPSNTGIFNQIADFTTTIIVLDDILKPPDQGVLYVCASANFSVSNNPTIQPASGTSGGSGAGGNTFSGIKALSKVEECGDQDNPGIPTAIGCIHTSPAGFVKDFLKFIIGISGGLAFLMMILGAFQMLTSAGNPDTLQAGRDRLQSAVIGLLFVIFAVLLLQIIGVDILKIPGFGR